MQNETINLKQHLAAIKEYWQPEIINRHGFQFRLVKLLGDYGWHTHGYSDKVLFAVEGDMAVDFADGGRRYARARWRSCRSRCRTARVRKTAARWC